MFGIYLKFYQNSATQQENKNNETAPKTEEKKEKTIEITLFYRFDKRFSVDFVLTHSHFCC